MKTVSSHLKGLWDLQRPRVNVLFSFQEEESSSLGVEITRWSQRSCNQSCFFQHVMLERSQLFIHLQLVHLVHILRLFSFQPKFSRIAKWGNLVGTRSVQKTRKLSNFRKENHSTENPGKFWNGTENFGNKFPKIWLYLEVVF